MSDIRTAAQREAEARYVGDPDEFTLSPAFAELRREGFVHGAAWAIRRATPTRQEIAEAIALGLDETKNLSDWSEDYQDEMGQAADAVLTLLKGEENE